MYTDNGEIKIKRNVIKRTKGVASVFLTFIMLLSLVMSSVPAIEAFAIAHDPDTHTWSYAVDGAKITATCGTDECEYKTTPVELTISASNASYTGSAYSGASVNSTAWTSAGLGTPSEIKYVGRDGTTYEESETAPSTVGTYKAKVTVTVPGAETPTDYTASADFEITAHVHSYTYSATGATITQTCGNPGHTGAANTLTIVAPTLTTYGGSGSAAATTTGSLDGVSTPSVVYKKGATTLDAAPTDAGTYTASITVDTDKTASVEYTIAKAEQEAPAAPTGSSTLHSITLDAITNGEYKMGDGDTWTETRTFSDLEMNTNYTFYQRLKGDDNHNPSSSSPAATISTSNHTHEYTYSASDATITQICGNSDGGHTGATSSTLTIVAPTLTTYGGSGDAEATLSGSLAGVANPTINYKQGDTELGTTAPTNPGTYTAYITLTGVDLTIGEQGNVTASVEYTIANASLTIEVSIAGWTYGETASEPSITGNTGSGAESFEYFTNAGCTTRTTTANGASAEGEVPSYAGTYWVKGSVAAAGGYGAGEDTETFTIAPKAITITAGDQTKVYGQSISSETTDVTVATFVSGDSLDSITVTPSTTNVVADGQVTPSEAVIKHGETTVTSNYSITYNNPQCLMFL